MPLNPEVNKSIDRKPIILGDPDLSYLITLNIPEGWEILEGGEVSLLTKEPTDQQATKTEN